jgi:hypothetical protein
VCAPSATVSCHCANQRAPPTPVRHAARDRTAASRTVAEVLYHKPNAREKNRDVTLKYRLEKIRSDPKYFAVHLERTTIPDCRHGGSPRWDAGAPTSVTHGPRSTQCTLLGSGGAGLTRAVTTAGGRSGVRVVALRALPEGPKLSHRGGLRGVQTGLFFMVLINQSCPYSRAMCPSRARCVV